MTARDPDSFLCGLDDADPDAVAAVVEAARLNLSRTAPSEDAYIDLLHKQRLTAFSARLRQASG